MTEFRAYIPPDPQEIVFKVSDDQLGPRIMEYDLMKYLPEYSHSVNDPELNGWLVYAKTPR